MRKQISLISALAFLATTFVASPALAAADPTVDQTGAFSLSGNTFAVTTDWTWIDGVTTHIVGTPAEQAYACRNSIANSGGASASNRSMILSVPADCQPLVTDASATTPFTSGDISASYVDTGIGGSAYSDQAATYKYITLVSIAETSSLLYYAFTATQEFTYVAPASPALTSADLYMSASVVGSNFNVSLIWAGAGLTLSTNPNSDGQYSFAGGGSAGYIYYELTDARVTNSSVTNIDARPGNLLQPSDSFDRSAPLTNVEIPLSGYSLSEIYPYVTLCAHIYVNEAGTIFQYLVCSASVDNPSYSSFGPVFSGGESTTPAPYMGPVVQAPGASSPKRPGERVSLVGSNLSGVMKAEIAGLDCQAVVKDSGEIEIVIPATLAAGTYDLLVTSDSGKLTIQDAISVSGSAVSSSGIVSAGTKLTDTSVRIIAMDVVGAGKVQLFFNGKEIAWVNAASSSDSKLRTVAGIPYLVRTVDLIPGIKNIAEIYVDGVRVKRAAYSG